MLCGSGAGEERMARKTLQEGMAEVNNDSRDIFRSVLIGVLLQNFYKTDDG